jgi:hypothetical protein
MKQPLALKYSVDNHSYQRIALASTLAEKGCRKNCLAGPWQGQPKFQTVWMTKANPTTLNILWLNR